jgi:hypothetical protein
MTGVDHVVTPHETVAEAMQGWGPKTLSAGGRSTLKTSSCCGGGPQVNAYRFERVRYGTGLAQLV